jgi:hypothetical protein
LKKIECFKSVNKRWNKDCQATDSAIEKIQCKKFEIPICNALTGDTAVVVEPQVAGVAFIAVECARWLWKATI